MNTLITATIRLYARNFALYNKIIAIVLVPVIILRLIARYAEFGSALNVAFSTIFGIILNVVLLFVILCLIKTTGDLTTKEPRKPTWRELTQCAKKKFLELLILFILLGLITLTVPAFILFLKKFFTPGTALVALDALAYIWVIVTSLLFIFSSFSLILENVSPVNGLNHGMELFLRKPIETFAQLLVAALLFGIIFTALALIVNIYLGFITKQSDLFFNLELARYFSPWWENLIIDIFAYLGLPLLVIATAIRFNRLRESDESSRLNNPAVT